MRTLPLWFIMFGSISITVSYALLVYLIYCFFSGPLQFGILKVRRWPSKYCRIQKKPPNLILPSTLKRHTPEGKCSGIQTPHMLSSDLSTFFQDCRFREIDIQPFREDKNPVVSFPAHEIKNFRNILLCSCVFPRENLEKGFPNLQNPWICLTLLQNGKVWIMASFINLRAIFS